MAGETIKSEAICLSVTPWSKTSHVVTWLTPSGRVGTVVKGAVRPKSAFLGQYDLNYTCEIVYYVRAKGELHALRECAPLDRRDALRDDYAALALAGYFRLMADRFAPQGPDSADWYATLSAALDALVANCAGSQSGCDSCSTRQECRVPSEITAQRGCDSCSTRQECRVPSEITAQRGRDIPVACPEGDHLIPLLLKTELRILHLLGLDPEIEAESGAFVLRGERKIPVSPEVAACIRDLSVSSLQPSAFNLQPALALDAARALGVYYDFHVDGVSDVRRAVFRLIHNKARELR